MSRVPPRNGVRMNPNEKELESNTRTKYILCKPPVNSILSSLNSKESIYRFNLSIEANGPASSSRFAVVLRSVESIDSRTVLASNNCKCSLQCRSMANAKPDHSIIGDRKPAGIFPKNHLLGGEAIEPQPNLSSSDFTKEEKMSPPCEPSDLVDRISSRCLDLCNVKKLADADDEAEAAAKLKREFQSTGPADLLRLAMTCQEDSKKIEAFLKVADQPTIDQCEEEFFKFLSKMITDPFGCYIASVLVERSTRYRKGCEDHCLAQIDSLVNDKNAVKVMQSLAAFSSRFCRFFLAYFKKNYDALINSMESVLLLNKVILNLEKEEDLIFLLDDIEANFKESDFGHPELLRILSSLMERLTGSNLSRLVRVLKPHICWLIDDKIGNYVVQNMFAAYWTSMGILRKVVFSSPKLLFIRRYRRFVLLKALQTPGNEDFFAHILKCLSDSKDDLGIIFRREPSTFLLLWVILRSSDFSQLKTLRQKVSAIQNKRGYLKTEQYFSDFLNALDTHMSHLQQRKRSSSMLTDEQEQPKTT